MSDLDPSVAETTDLDLDEDAAPVPLGVASEETRGSWVGVVSDGFLNGWQLN